MQLNFQDISLPGCNKKGDKSNEFNEDSTETRSGKLMFGDHPEPRITEFPEESRPQTLS